MKSALLIQDLRYISKKVPFEKGLVSLTMQIDRLENEG